jgi:paraquat-inducible protein B
LRGIEQLVNAPELREAIHNLNVTLQGTKQLVQSLDTQVERVATSATTTLGSFTKLAQNADSQLVPLLTSLRETSKAALVMMVNGQDTLNTLRVFLTPTAPVGYELTKTLQELADAGRAIRVLANSLERNPNALLFGKRDGGGK